jgi:hypothetical protein
MGLIIIIPFGALAGWSIFAIARWLLRDGYGREWWNRFAMLAAVGLVVGVWFAGFSKYKMANFHLEGFPIPSHIQSPPQGDTPATDSNMPWLIRSGVLVTDFLSGVAVCLAPIAVALFFKENKGKLVGPPRGPDPQS